MAEKAMFDYHKLTPHELKLLDLMKEQQLWTILEFGSKLLEQRGTRGKKRKIRSKTEDQYRDFLKQRSNLFGMC